MSRILLIGRGPLPTPESPKLGFSELRTAAFAEAIRGTGAELRIVLLVPQREHDGESSPRVWPGVTSVVENSPGWIDHVQSASEGADGIVSAGPFAPGRVAAAIAGNTPLWVDIPGDPLAELAALARAEGSQVDDSTIAAAHAACTAVLSRADAISVISGAQRFSALGQLGLMGRTLRSDTTPSVAVIPITANFGFNRTVARHDARSGSATIALAGAFNPWFNDRAVCQALDVALAARPGFRVAVTGGGISGFYEEGFKRFQRWAKRHPDRVVIHGWLPHAEMERVLKQADIGMTMDCGGPEPELGSRTRLLLFAELGLIPASTVVCELSRSWAEAGALIPLEADPEHAGRTLAGIDVTDAALVNRARNLIAGSIQSDPFNNWCKAPFRTGPGIANEGILAAEVEALKAELSRIHNSPTWTALSRLHTLSRGRFIRPRG